MLTAMVCPDGTDTPKDVCQETTNNRGEVKGFYDRIWGTVFNYGCNCNQDNFRVQYTNPDSGNSWLSVYPGSNALTLTSNPVVLATLNSTKTATTRLLTPGTWMETTFPFAELKVTPNIRFSHLTAIQADMNGTN